MQFDPRTVAREIPGIFDAVFPQLTPGLVAHFNREAAYIEIEPIDDALLEASDLQAAMLSELSFALAEARLSGESEDWAACLDKAVERQRRHYDAVIPLALSSGDKTAATTLAQRLIAMVEQMAADVGALPLRAPRIPGFQWISTGVGDLSIGPVLLEVKFGSRRFSSADYRQVVIYWLLTYLSSIENDSSVWTDFVLLNPRLGRSVHVRYAPFLNLIGGGRTTVEIAQAFQVLISSRGEKS
jgi:hypothetical protein